MKIGTVLTMELNNPEKTETKTYRSNIIEKNAQYLFVNLPIDNETNKTVYFTAGTLVKITYIGADQAVHMFISKIMAKINDDIPALAIQMPDKEAIRTIQRRQFVRIDTAVDVAVHTANDSFTTVSSDISGGGMSIIVPEAHSFEVNEKADVWIVLRMNTGFQYVNASTEIIRMNDDNGIRKASMKYIAIDEKQQQSIIRFCFEKQLEARRKELS